MNKRETIGDLLCIVTRITQGQMRSSRTLWFSHYRNELYSCLTMIELMLDTLCDETVNKANILTIVEYLRAPHSIFRNHLDYNTLNKWERNNFTLSPNIISAKEQRVIDIMIDMIEKSKNLLKHRPTDYKIKLWYSFHVLYDLAKVFRNPQGYPSVVLQSNIPPTSPDDALRTVESWIKRIEG